MSVTRRGLWSGLLTLAMSRLPLVEKSQLYQSALIMREVLVGSLPFSRLPDVDRRRLLVKSADARPPSASKRPVEGNGCSRREPYDVHDEFDWFEILQRVQKAPPVTTQFHRLARCKIA